MKKLYVLLNPRSGSVGHLADSPDEFRARLEAAGYDAVIDADPDASFEQRLERAGKSDADTLLAAGGDGTVTAVAETAISSGKPLAILPLGTANLLARDLGLSLNPEQWMAQLPTLEPRVIDVGRVNGRPFLHKVAIGFVPGIAAAREKLRGHESIGAQMGFVSHAIRRIARARRFAIEVTRDDGAPHIDRVQALAVANNAYDEQLGHFFARSVLDAGHLTLYKLDHLTVLGSFRLAAGLLLGRWTDDAALAVDIAHDVTIRSRHRSIKVMLDGEVETMATPLRFNIEPRALTVMAAPTAIAGDSANSDGPASADAEPDIAAKV